MENELTTSFPVGIPMSTVPASVYTAIQAQATSINGPKKVAQDSLASHRNTHR